MADKSKQNHAPVISAGVASAVQARMAELATDVSMWDKQIKSVVASQIKGQILAVVESVDTGPIFDADLTLDFASLKAPKVQVSKTTETSKKDKATKAPSKASSGLPVPQQQPALQAKGSK